MGQLESGIEKTISLIEMSGRENHLSRYHVAMNVTRLPAVIQSIALSPVLIFDLLLPSYSQAPFDLFECSSHRFRQTEVEKQQAGQANRRINPECACRSKRRIQLKVALVKRLRATNHDPIVSKDQTTQRAGRSNYPDIDSAEGAGAFSISFVGTVGIMMRGVPCRLQTMCLLRG